MLSSNQNTLIFDQDNQNHNLQHSLSNQVPHSREQPLFEFKLTLNKPLTPPTSNMDSNQSGFTNFPNSIPIYDPNGQISSKQQGIHQNLNSHDGKRTPEEDRSLYTSNNHGNHLLTPMSTPPSPPVRPDEIGISTSQHLLDINQTITSTLHLQSSLATLYEDSPSDLLSGSNFFSSTADSPKPRARALSDLSGLATPLNFLNIRGNHNSFSSSNNENTSINNSNNDVKSQSNLGLVISNDLSVFSPGVSSAILPSTNQFNALLSGPLTAPAIENSHDHFFPPSFLNTSNALNNNNGFIPRGSPDMQSSQLQSALSCSSLADLLYDTTLNSASVSPTAPNFQINSPNFQINSPFSKHGMDQNSILGSHGIVPTGLSFDNLFPQVNNDYIKSPGTSNGIPAFNRKTSESQLSLPNNTTNNPLHYNKRMSLPMRPNGLDNIEIPQITPPNLQTSPYFNNSSIGTNNSLSSSDIPNGPVRSVSISSVGSISGGSSPTTTSTFSATRTRRGSANEKLIDIESVLVTNSISETKGSYNKTRIDILANQAIIDDNGNLTCPFHGCRKNFPKQYNLRSHLVSHFAERPYQCTHCDKAFQRKHDLQRHLGSIHANEFPFMCRCGAKFQKAELLRRHKVAKHPGLAGRKRSVSTPVQPTFLKFQKHLQQRQQKPSSLAMPMNEPINMGFNMISNTNNPNIIANGLLQPQQNQNRPLL